MSPDEQLARAVFNELGAEDRATVAAKGVTEARAWLLAHGLRHHHAAAEAHLANLCFAEMQHTVATLAVGVRYVVLSGMGGTFDALLEKVEGDRAHWRVVEPRNPDWHGYRFASDAAIVRRPL